MCDLKVKIILFRDGGLSGFLLFYCQPYEMEIMERKKIYITFINQSLQARQIKYKISNFLTSFGN